MYPSGDVVLRNPITGHRLLRPRRERPRGRRAAENRDELPPSHPSLRKGALGYRHRKLIGALAVWPKQMADDVAACVREVVAIAGGTGTVAERRMAAEQRIAKLLKNEAEKTLSHHGIAQDLRDRLSAALNAEHDHDAREVLDEVIDLLRDKIGLV